LLNWKVKCLPKLVSMAQAVKKIRTLRTLVIMYANGYIFFTCAYCAEISEVMNNHLR
jgi:hypothetical protein